MGASLSFCGIQWNTDLRDEARIFSLVELMGTRIERIKRMNADFPALELTQIKFVHFYKKSRSTLIRENPRSSA